MRIITTLILSICSFNLIAKVPDNDNVKGAKPISNTVNFCSNDAEFNNIDATASGIGKGIFWKTEGKDVWFKFVPLKTHVSISVHGKTNAASPNTLINPTIALYTEVNNVFYEAVGSMNSDNNLTTAHKGGLTIGETYYVRISAEQDATGTFKLCLNNYNPPLSPGQDCATASILCNKETFTQLKLSGAGLNNQEIPGACFTVESNTAWYKWTAADSGTLVFTITPTNTEDDLDWVLYDLGMSGDCSNLLPGNLLRCAAGSGVTCSPSYYKTGLNFASTDLTEYGGCVVGQDGFVKYIDMIKGHVYALIIDNFSSANNGFTLEFGGTGDFVGPRSEILVTKNNLCTDAQSFTFSANVKDVTKLTWSFGNDADIRTANTNGPHTIKYSSPGLKTIVLEAEGYKKCVTISSYNLQVPIKPQKPIITANKPSFCLFETLKLTTNAVPDATYIWTGPNGFNSTEREPVILLDNLNQAGDYTLTVKLGDCYSDATTLNIPLIVKNPLASFTTNLSTPLVKYLLPISIQFHNTSKNADNYIWDFGDGTSSKEINPTHTYTEAGKYNITLTAFTNNGCKHSFMLSNLIVLKAGSLLVPNAFSPNGDNYNDEFNINITDFKKFNIRIFNRYGEKLFESDDILKNWDGNYQNRAVPVGAYFYYIKVVDFFDKESTYKGSITLIR